MYGKRGRERQGGGVVENASTPSERIRRNHMVGSDAILLDEAEFSQSKRRGRHDRWVVDS